MTRAAVGGAAAVFSMLAIADCSTAIPPAAHPQCLAVEWSSPWNLPIESPCRRGDGPSIAGATDRGRSDAGMRVEGTSTGDEFDVFGAPIACAIP